MPTSGKDLVKEAKKHGWKIDRIEGSHHIMINGTKTVSIPVHKNKDLRTGIEADLREQLGIMKGQKK